MNRKQDLNGLQDFGSAGNAEPRFSFVMIVLNGLPFIEFSLKSIYDFAHQIIIVEGAVENCLFAANPDGSSKDGTVEFLKSFPDPHNKIILIQGIWPEKSEMQNRALAYVTGDYVWLIDSDEVYKRTDLHKIREILAGDPSITQVNFIPESFWKGLDYTIHSEKFFEAGHHARRVFKYLPGALFTTHRPPTLVWPGSARTTEQMHLLDGFSTRRMGITFYHYNYVSPAQVRQKNDYYGRLDKAPNRWSFDRNTWYTECFLKWTPQNRHEIEKRYPVWLGDKNSCTRPFTGTHPEVMAGYIHHVESADELTAGPKSAHVNVKRRPPVIHFAYSGDPYDDNAMRAPQTITNRLFRFLEKRAHVRYYDAADTTTDIDVQPDDVILGHPWPDKNTVIRRLFEKSAKAKYLIWPFHSRIPEINRYAKDLAAIADRLFLISGPYWIDTIDQTEYADWKDKIVRLDNAVDAARFPLLKKQFNPPGRRGLFVLGRSGREKGTTELFRLLTPVAGPVVIAGSYKADDLAILKDRPNTRWLGYTRWTEAATTEFIMQHCDFFVNMSVSDASPTTLLECMALGLIPVTTPQCGYPRDTFIHLSLSNPDHNLKVLEQIQHLDDNRLHELQAANRRIIEQEHTWDKFCTTVWNVIERDQAAEKKLNPQPSLADAPAVTRTKKACKNLLWIRTDSIGDNVLAASMLEHVRKKYADAKITVVCQEHIGELYRCCPYVDDIITFDKRRIVRDANYARQIIRRLQDMQPDVSLNSVYSREPLTDVLALQCGAPERIGCMGNLANIDAHVRDHNNRFYTKLVDDTGEQTPELLKHAAFLKAIGIDAPPLQATVWTSPDDEAFADRLFSENGLDPQRTIAFFAATQRKEHFYEHYGRALSQLCESQQISAVALGGRGDEAINQRNLDAIGTNTLNLTGRTRILQAAAIIRRCRLAVGADTGLAHIACAAGTPNVVLLGGAHFGRFMPYSPLTSIVCLPLDCYGCSWKCKDETFCCVHDVSPEVIAEAIRRTWEKPSSTKSRVFVQGSSLWRADDTTRRWRPLDEVAKTENIEAIVVESGIAARRPSAVPAVISRQPEYDVSIVVGTKNRARLLDQMLTSLEAAVGNIRCEVIIIDGDSTDNTLQVVQEHGIKKVYSEAQCLGPGRHSWAQVCNLGFSRARGKWAMYGSDDILYSKDCLAEAVQILNRQGPEVAGGLFFYKNAYGRPDWDRFGIDFTYGQKLLMNYGLFRLDYLRQVGGLNEQYRFYCADGDMCYRYYSTGKQFVVLPECFIVHNNVLDIHKQEHADASHADIALYKENWKHFVSTDPPHPRRLLWHEDYIEAFSLPNRLDRLSPGVEYYWHGLACFQYGLFKEAQTCFERAIASQFDHDLVRWFLQQSRQKCAGPERPQQASSIAREFVENRTKSRTGDLPTASPDDPPTGSTALFQDEDMANESSILQELQQQGLWQPGTPLRLHLGCGKWHFDGYINIDYPLQEHTVVKRLGADYHADITQLRFPDHSVDEIRLHHVFEHFSRVTSLAMLIRWHRWLKPGGRLHIEAPDLIGSARTLLSEASWKTKMGVVRHLAGDQAAKWGYHADHWFAERFEHTLKSLGFATVSTRTSAWPHEPYLSNVEVVAVKAADLEIEQQLNAADRLLWESTVAEKERETWQVWRQQLRELLTPERESDFALQGQRRDT
jgi:ADP-heptose:LPS heptosyltransferase/glycosyltransferase involved in cell wall biosynthesis